MAAALVALVVSWVGCAPSGGGDDKPRFAFVTNMPASFWVIAQKGVEKAGEDLDVNVSVDMPADGVTGQKRVLEDLLARGVKSIQLDATVFDGHAVQPAMTVSAKYIVRLRSNEGT